MFCCSSLLLLQTVYKQYATPESLCSLFNVLAQAVLSCWCRRHQCCQCQTFRRSLGSNGGSRRFWDSCFLREVVNCQSPLKCFNWILDNHRAIQFPDSGMGQNYWNFNNEQLMVPLAPNLSETDLISELLGVTLGPKKAARKALIKNWCALWRPFASICPLDAVGAGNLPTCAVLLGFRVVNTGAHGQASAFGTSFEILLQGNRLPFALSYFSRSSRVQGDWRKWSKKNQHDPNERVGLNWRTEGLLDFLVQ